MDHQRNRLRIGRQVMGSLQVCGRRRRDSRAPRAKDTPSIARNRQAVSELGKAGKEMRCAWMKRQHASTLTPHQRPYRLPEPGVELCPRISRWQHHDNREFFESQGTAMEKRGGRQMRTQPWILGGILAIGVLLGTGRGEAQTTFVFANPGEPVEFDPAVL